MSSNCRLDGSHQFEPRYDEVLPSVADTFFQTITGPADAIKNKIYVMDVCVKCGEQIKRSGKEKT